MARRCTWPQTTTAASARPSALRRARATAIRSAALTSLLALLTLPLSAAAADDDEDENGEPEYARSGLYLRGAAGMAVWSSFDSFPGAPDVSWQPDFGLDLEIGWRNSERVALEFAFQWIINHEGIGWGSWLLGVNGKFYLLEDRIQPYVVLGANAMWTDIPGAYVYRDDWAFRNGLGVDYYLTNHWALSAESTFVWGVGDVWKNYFVTFTVGAMYRF